MCSYSCEPWQNSVRHSWHRQHERSQWTRNAVIDVQSYQCHPAVGKQISAAPSQSKGKPRLLGVEEFSSGKSLWKSASSCTYWAQKCMCASWRRINNTSSLTQTAGSLCQTQTALEIDSPGDGCQTIGASGATCLSASLAIISPLTPLEHYFCCLRPIYITDL